MATVGALNGTDVMLRVLNSSTGAWVAVGGQVSHTETLTNTPLDITNKVGSPDVRELLPDEGLQAVDYTTDLIFNSDTAFALVRALASSKSTARFQVLRGDVDSGTVPIETTLMVTSFAETSDAYNPLRATVTLLSSDLFTYAADYTYQKYVPSGSDAYITAAGDTYFVRAP